MIPYLIKTPRLILRCWNPEDARKLKAAVDASLEHLRPWMTWAALEPQPLETKIESLRKCRAQFDLDQQYVFGILNPDQTLVLGSSGLHRRLDGNALEIGYWIHVDWINRGYATETAGALTKAAFNYFGVERVEIHCDALNLRSAAIPRKLGFKMDATLRRRSASAENEPHDSMIWSLFADEYPSSPCSRLPIQVYNVAGEPI